MQNELKVTVGLPRSGKTTWARQQGCPIVSPDSIRLALHGMAFVQMAEDIVWAIAKLMVRALFLSGHHKVVVDATNVTPNRREFWEPTLGTKEEGSWFVTYRVFRTDVKVCKDRAIEVGREDLVPVIERMAEGWDETGLPD